MILEHLHFCLVSCACLSHLLCGKLHLLECYYRNCLMGTHVCTSSIKMISFFYPSVWIVHKLFQIMPALCTHGQGEGGGGGGGGSIKRGQAWTRGGRSQKFPNLCGHPLWITLLWQYESKNLILLEYTTMKSLLPL